MLIYHSTMEIPEEFSVFLDIRAGEFGKKMRENRSNMPSDTLRVCSINYILYG